MTMLTRVPESIGSTELAYISDGEKKILRRREAMRGFPGSKHSAQGIPVLADSREDIIAHARGLGIANVPDANVSRAEFKKFTNRLNATKTKQRTGAVGTSGNEKGKKKFVLTPEQKARSSTFYKSDAGKAHAAKLGKPKGFGIRAAPTVTHTTSCFVDGVQVELADGSKKNVSEISVGDIVKTNEGSGSVVKVFPAKAGNQLLYGFNGKEPFVTEAHPFMTQDGWKKISEVREGDTLYRNGLGNQIVESIESKEVPEDTPVYNFHVDKHENYYADSYLVHNKKTPSGDSRDGTICEDTMGEEYDGIHPNCTLKPGYRGKGGGGGGGGGGGPDIAAGIFDQGKLNKPILEEVVIYGPKSEIIQERLKNLIDTNSPLFKAATTKALQSMQPYGLANSSIATEAVTAAILAVAVPIAQADAQAFMNQRQLNAQMSNEFKFAQNEAYYAAFNKKMDNAIQNELRRLTEQSANWRAVLTARGNIATTRGMSRDAAAAAMRAVTPGWFI